MKISDKDRDYLKKLLSEKMLKETRIVLFTQEMECDFCQDTREIAELLTSLSEKIKLETYDFIKDAEIAKTYGVDKIPALVLPGEGDRKARFFGIPSGYEFRSLIDDILNLSRGETDLSEGAKAKIRSITQPLHIQVFVTPTCPYCPSMVRFAHQAAFENPMVTGDMVESTEFPHLAHRYGVMSVPKTIINEGIEIVGAVPEDHFIGRLFQAAEKRPMFV